MTSVWPLLLAALWDAAPGVRAAAAPAVGRLGALAARKPVQGTVGGAIDALDPRRSPLDLSTRLLAPGLKSAYGRKDCTCEAPFAEHNGGRV